MDGATRRITTTTVGTASNTQTSERGPGVSVPPTVAYAAGFGLAWWFHQIMPLPVDVEGSVIRTILGWSLVGVGTALFIWALRIFFVVRTGIMLQKPATSLMMAGPYAWSRNPQYIAFSAMYAGAALIGNTLWPFILLPAVLLIVGGGVIAREERYLHATFGDSYADYCRRVGRWF